MLFNNPFVMLLALLLGLASPHSAPQYQEYRLVPAESSFRVFVGKTGLFSALAHDHNIGIRSYAGKVTLAPTAIAASRLELRADTRSLAVLDEKISDRDREKITRSMHEEVLESARYPEAIFRSTGISGLKDQGRGELSLLLQGDLTLHGQTRSITIPVTLRTAPGQLRATGRYLLRQSDFGIRPYSTAGGTIKVKNEVVIEFEITARN